MGTEFLHANPISSYTTPKPSFEGFGVVGKSGADLLSRGRSAISLARSCFTVLFGMEGGSAPARHQTKGGDLREAEGRD